MNGREDRSQLIDRKRLMAEYGFTGSSADRIMRQCHIVRLPGERKHYIRREDVDRLVQDHTWPPVAA